MNIWGRGEGGTLIHPLMSELWSTGAMEYYAAVKRSDILIHATM